MKHFGMTMDMPIPGFLQVFQQYSLALVFLDAAFYWSHRMLHTPYFYKTVHKQHHEFKGSIGFASEVSPRRFDA